MLRATTCSGYHNVKSAANRADARCGQSTDRIGHANMAYTLAITQVHWQRPGCGRNGRWGAPGGRVDGWRCPKCITAHIGTAPENGLCEACGGDGTAAVPVPT